MVVETRLVDDLARWRAEAGGKSEKAAARRAQGLMTARDRLDSLFEAGTFQEVGQHARSNDELLSRGVDEPGGDGVVTGIGYVEGRPAAAFSQDFTVADGSLGRTHAEKICTVMDYAGRTGFPFVGIHDSGGARIREGIDALSGYGGIFHRHARLSGVVPQIAVVAGPCVGAAAFSPALADFVVMLRRHARQYVCGPEVIRAATGRSTGPEEIGGAESRAASSGDIHFVAEDDAEALDIVRRLLSYLPSNNMAEPPHRLADEISIGDDTVLNELVPEDGLQPLDVKTVIKRLADVGSFLEVQAQFARNLVIGFARIEGCVVGIVANQPTVKAGTLDIDASDKGARFIRTCDAFNIPLVTLVDVPGFLPGIDQERGGLARHGAKMLFAFGAATVPKITVVMGKAYGAAGLAMCGHDLGADMVLAWPNAEIALMGAEGAIRVLYRRELETADKPTELAEELAGDYHKRFASPYQAATRGSVTDVIEPARTRPRVALALRTLLSKSEMRPPRKHGNIPL